METWIGSLFPVAIHRLASEKEPQEQKTVDMMPAPMIGYSTAMYTLLRAIRNSVNMKDCFAMYVATG
jgi:hypothetical protein